MVWRIFVRDFLRVLRNPIALIVTIAIIFLPGLYSWANIAANWDPYSNAKNLQVAVANNDAGSHSQLTGTINVGSQVVTQLKDNHSLGWQFVTNAQAKEGVASGKYYAALVIPENFSSHLIGALQGTSSRPRLVYYVNEKLNPIAPKVTDIGAETIEENINTQFIKQVSKAVVQQLKKGKSQALGDISSSRNDAVATIDDAITDISSTQNSMNSVVASLNKAKGSLDSVDKTLSDLDGTISNLRTSLKTSQNLIDATQSGLHRFSSSASSVLTSGVANMSLLAIQVNTASATVNQSISDVSAQAGKAEAKLTSIVALNESVVSQLQTALTSSGLNKNSDLYQKLSSRISSLKAQADAQRSALQTFTSSSSASLAASQKAASSLGSAISSAATNSANTLNTANSQITGTMITALDSTLGSLRSVMGSADGTLIALRSDIRQSRNILVQLSTLMDQTSSTLKAGRKSLNSAKNQLDSVRTDLIALDSSAAWKKIQGISPDPKEISAFISSPVLLNTKTVYPISNYGSAIAPFYTNLALWVGGFILIAIIKSEVDREGLKRFSARDAYLGRLMMFLLVGLMQGLVTAAGDLLMGIQCQSPGLFILASVFLSFTYVSIIYSLAIAFKHIGKAIAVLLVIVQIPGSSGTYPIELMPKFFRSIEPWLPFTYGINAMRETIGGMYRGAYWHNLAMLLPFVIAAYFIGIFVRPYLLNLNALFDRRLSETDLFIAEKNNLTNSRFRLSNVLQNLLDNDEYKERIQKRTQAFLEVYPRLVVAGIVAIAVIPVIFLILMFVVPVKIGFLIAWIVSIIVIDTFLIVLEYMHDSYIRELGLSEIPDEGARLDLLRRIRTRWFPSNSSAERLSKEHPHIKEEHK